MRFVAPLLAGITCCLPACAAIFDVSYGDVAHAVQSVAAPQASRWIDGTLSALTSAMPAPESATYALIFAGLAILAGGRGAHHRNRIVPPQD